MWTVLESAINEPVLVQTSGHKRQQSVAKVKLVTNLDYLVAQNSLYIIGLPHLV